MMNALQPCCRKQAYCFKMLCRQYKPMISFRLEFQEKCVFINWQLQFVFLELAIRISSISVFDLDQSIFKVWDCHQVTIVIKQYRVLSAS
jgi:hypothetical protein